MINLSNPWRYAGQYFDTATGLYKIGAQYYQPELGRWTRQDRSGQDAIAYAYVGGYPVNFVEPSGLSAFSEFKDYLTAEDADTANDDLNIATGFLLPKPQRGKLLGTKPTL